MRKFTLMSIVLVIMFSLVIIEIFGLWVKKITYVDIVNGNTKTSSISILSRNCSEVVETRFSLIVRNNNLQADPVWTIAYYEERGLRRWFFPQKVSMKAGSTLAAMQKFSDMVEVGIIEDVRGAVLRIRDLAEKGNGRVVEKYVQELFEDGLNRVDR